MQLILAMQDLAKINWYLVITNNIQVILKSLGLLEIKMIITNLDNYKAFQVAMLQTRTS